jgi:hypothetical protein
MHHLFPEELHLFSQCAHLLLKRMPVILDGLLHAPVRQLQLERHHLLLEPLVIRLESSCYLLQPDIGVDLVRFVLPYPLFESRDVVGATGPVGALREAVLGLALLREVSGVREGGRT